MEIRNWVKILLASTPLPPFTTTKTGSKDLAILFLKCILNLNAYPRKKRMPKSNHYYSKYGGWRFVQGNATIRNLAPPLVRICICQGKMIRGIPIFFVRERFHLQYLPKKIISKADQFSQRPHKCWTLVRHSVRQRKMVRAFCKKKFARQS
jgi:hypothetical protein